MTELARARLQGFGDTVEFDRAICVMALMDIPDLGAVYRAVRRVVRGGGWFVIAMTHPRFDSPHADSVETEDGTGRLVTHYWDEEP